MRIDMNAWRRDLIANQHRSILPIMTHPGIASTGATVREALSDGRRHAAAIEALARAHPTAAATMAMDLSVEAEAFGATVRFEEHEVPTVTAPAVGNRAEVESLPIPETDAARIPQYLVAANLASSAITDRPVLAGAIGPFSLAGRLLDMTEIMTAIMLEPDMVRLLLQKCTSFLVAYVTALKRAGAHGVVIAEPAAGMLSAGHCAEFSSSFIAQIVAAVQDDSFLCVLHNCGNTDDLVPSLLTTGARAFHFGNSANMVDRLERLPADVLVMGNLDPVALRNGSPSQVRAATAELLGVTSSYPNFVLSSGCDMPPGIPQENIDAFFDAWRAAQA